MVSFVHSDTVHKRRRTDALSPIQQRQTARHRKQTLMSKLSDSGFEEDFGSPATSPPARIDVSPLRSDEPPAGKLSSWYLQYGDIGYRIQREKEAQFDPCKSLARQPQVGLQDTLHSDRVRNEISLLNGSVKMLLFFKGIRLTFHISISSKSKTKI